MQASEREKWDARHVAGVVLGAIYAKVDPQRRHEMSDTMAAAAARADSVPSWFSHVAGRFDIALEDCWMGERDRQAYGTARLDVLVARLRWPILREAVEENPSLLTMIAKEGPLPDELAPTAEIQAREPWMMPVPTGDLLPVPSLRTIWTAESPMAHGADDRRGNVILFRRESVVDLLTGEVARCPFISGNSIRHSLRRLAAEHLYEFVGVAEGAVNPELHHALTSGGVIDAGSEMAKVSPVIRRALRELYPAWELFGGIAEKQVCHGGWSVHDATLVCRENASRLMHQHLFPAPAGTEAIALAAANATGEVSRRETRAAYLKALTERLSPALSLMQMRQYTKHIDPDVPSTSDTMHAMWDTEVAIAGSQWLHFVTVDPTASDVARSAAAFVLDRFASHPYLAAANSRGHGLVSFAPYAPAVASAALPGPDLYLSRLESMKTQIVEWLTSGVVAKTAGDEPKTEKPARKRR